jgi:hypothetical protein
MHGGWFGTLINVSGERDEGIPVPARSSLAVPASSAVRCPERVAPEYVRNRR